MKEYDSTISLELTLLRHLVIAQDELLVDYRLQLTPRSGTIDTIAALKKHLAEIRKEPS